MHMIMLVEQHFPPMPEQLELIQNFGHETVHGGDGRYHHGESLLISGEPEAFRNWLGGEQVWSTTNPMLGRWERGTIKSL